MKVAAIIPARLDSTRLPRKVLLPVAGVPLIQRVVENARDARLVEEVIVATDSEEVREFVEGIGARVIMTPGEGIHSGSDRIAAAARQIDHGIIVNVQGDEPFMTGKMIDECVAPLLQDEKLNVCTLCRVITKREEFDDPGVVKVVRDVHGNGLYFSRHRIPYPRTKVAHVLYEHLGIYAYRREFLETFSSWGPTPLELAEGLEMLRMIEHGVKLLVVDTAEDTSHYLSIDTEEDRLKAERHIEEMEKHGH